MLPLENLRLVLSFSAQLHLHRLSLHRGACYEQHNLANVQQCFTNPSLPPGRVT